MSKSAITKMSPRLVERVAPVYSRLSKVTNGKLNVNDALKIKATRGRPKKIQIKTVIKSTGDKQPFSKKKAERSIILAGRDTGEYNKKQAGKIIKRISTVLSLLDTDTITSSDIRTIVEPILASEGYFKTARYYILVKERSDFRKRKKFKVTEPNISNVGLEIAKKRYLMTDLKGKNLETVGQMFWRVARHIAKAEINWSGNGVVEDTAKKFFERMVNWKFIPTGKAMFEAGNPGGSGQMSACFVLPIEDSIHSIFKTLGDGAVVQKNNGGTGYNFSKIRPHGDKVKNVPGAASGPVDFLRAYSSALSQILQGAKRQGANIAILNVDHPDIEEFINLKDTDGTIKNFNISVGVTNKFMEAIANDQMWGLISPRNGQVWKKMKARKLFAKIVEHAWIGGDPGLAFLDRMEEDNPTPTFGKIDATNPCGEIPLLPYESCNLTSICLHKHLIEKNDKGELEIDWEDLEKSVRLAVRFLDNMIEVNTYPIKEIEEMVKFGNRRIGVGVLGFAHMLYKLKISYSSKEAVRLAERLSKFIHKTAESESIKLAKIRGVFPNFDSSIYVGSAERYRNSALTMVAPTGTISILANTSSGIEPVFSLVTLRRTFNEDSRDNRPTREFMIIDPIFEEAIDNIDIKLLKSKSTGSILKDKKSILATVIKNGLHDVVGFPKWFYKVFTTTHDIAPEWHVKIQAAWQKWFDNSVSKTINFPNSATVDDIKKAYLMAWKLGCKGITIYRDGSKDDQVLNTGLTREKKKNHELKRSINLGKLDKCPECGNGVVPESGCIICKVCGWSECKL